MHISLQTQFISEAGEAWRLSVRQDVKSKVGLKQLGRSILVFDFEPAAAVTAESSPTATSGREVPPPARDSSSAAADPVAAAAAGGTTAVEEAAGEAGEQQPGRGAVEGAGAGAEEGAAGGEGAPTVGSTATSRGGCCVVFFHNRVSDTAVSIPLYVLVSLECMQQHLLLGVC